MKSILETLIYITQRVIIALICIYILLLVALFFFQESLIFFPQPKSVFSEASPIERLDYDIGEVRLAGFIKKGEGPTYFYFGGNASEAYRSFTTLNMSGTIISFNYRGYGESQGKPSEKNLFQDAVMLYDLLQRDGKLTQKDTILFGRSLGSGVASYLSSVRPSKALILVTPFDSLLDIARDQYPYVPVKWFLRHHFLSLKYLNGYNNPVLVIYGGKDLAIPNVRTENLIDHLPNNKKTLFIEEANHDNIHLFDDYMFIIDGFSRELFPISQ